MKVKIYLSQLEFLKWHISNLCWRNATARKTSACQFILHAESLTHKHCWFSAASVIRLFHSGPYISLASSSGSYNFSGLIRENST